MNYNARLKILRISSVNFTAPGRINALENRYTAQSTAYQSTPYHRNLRIQNDRSETQKVTGFAWSLILGDFWSRNNRNWSLHLKIKNLGSKTEDEFRDIKFCSQFILVAGFLDTHCKTYPFISQNTFLYDLWSMRSWIVCLLYEFKNIHLFRSRYLFHLSWYELQGTFICFPEYIYPCMIEAFVNSFFVVRV